MAFPASRNSTTVRSESPLDPWPQPAYAPSCAPALVLTAWTLFVAFASTELVFARLEEGAYMALVLFVNSIALASARIDADATARLALVKRPLAAALALDAALISLACALAGEATQWNGFPGAALLMVVMPLALVLHAEAWRRPRLRTAPGASPGARRAAT